MFGKVAIGLTALNTAVYCGWQFASSTSTTKHHLIDHFTLSDASTIQEKRVWTLFLYQVSHTSFIHLCSNVGVLLSIGSAIERLEGMLSIAKLGLISAPVGFMVTYTLGKSGNTSTGSCPTTRGGGCLSSALVTYYISVHSADVLHIWGRAVKGWQLGVGLMVVECLASLYLAGNNTLDPELGGALAAVYLVAARKLILRQ